MNADFGHAADAVATVGTGVVLAREAERVHASAAHHPGQQLSSNCANCGASLTGPFCAACGQHGHVHRTVGALFHDLLHGVLHFEGKFWRTLPLLAWSPGELTRRYVHGERARFVSPVALFLFSVFLLFAVLSNLPNMTFASDALKGWQDAEVATARAKLQEDRRKADEGIAALTDRLRVSRAEAPADAVRIAAMERELTVLRRLRANIARADAVPPPTAANTNLRFSSSSSWLEQRVRAALKNPQLMFYKIKASAYKWSWALIPLSLPFIWLLFPLRRGVGMYDHAVFATYSLSFVSLMVVTIGILNAVGMPSTPLAFAGLIIPVVHIFRQLKGAYRLSWAGALWRTGWMIMFVTLILPLFAMLLLVLGVAD